MRICPWVLVCTLVVATSAPAKVMGVSAATKLASTVDKAFSKATKDASTTMLEASTHEVDDTYIVATDRVPFSLPVFGNLSDVFAMEIIKLISIKNVFGPVIQAFSGVASSMLGNMSDIVTPKGITLPDIISNFVYGLQQVMKSRYISGMPERMSDMLQEALRAVTYFLAKPWAGYLAVLPSIILFFAALFILVPKQVENFLEIYRGYSTDNPQQNIDINFDTPEDKIPTTEDERKKWKKFLQFFQYTGAVRVFLANHLKHMDIRFLYPFVFVLSQLGIISKPQHRRRKKTKESDRESKNHDQQLPIMFPSLPIPMAPAPMAPAYMTLAPRMTVPMVPVPMVSNPTVPTSTPPVPMAPTSMTRSPMTRVLMAPASMARAPMTSVPMASTSMARIPMTPVSVASTPMARAPMTSTAPMTPASTARPPIASALNSPSRPYKTPMPSGLSSIQDSKKVVIPGMVFIPNSNKKKESRIPEKITDSVSKRYNKDEDKTVGNDDIVEDFLRLFKADLEKKKTGEHHDREDSGVGGLDLDISDGIVEDLLGQFKENPKENTINEDQAGGSSEVGAPDISDGIVGDLLDLFKENLDINKIDGDQDGISSGVGELDTNDGIAEDLMGLFKETLERTKIDEDQDGGSSGVAGLDTNEGIVEDLLGIFKESLEKKEIDEDQDGGSSGVGDHDEGAHHSPSNE